MPRRGGKRSADPTCEAWAVLEEVDGPHGPDILSVSFIERRLTRRCRGRGDDRTTEWFVDGLPVASREAADAALLSPPAPGAEPPTLRPAPPDAQDALQRFLQALAVAQARRDHEAEMAERARAAAERKREKNDSRA